MEYKYDVFVSYSRKDYVYDDGNVIENSPIKTIIEFLDENKISYWFDKDGIYSGREFIEMIAEAIGNSKMMLFVSSYNSNASIYTTGEIFEAIEGEKLIIPIRIDDSQYNSKFKLLVRPLDYIDFSKADAMKDLLRAIEKENEIIHRKEVEAEKKRKKLELEANKNIIKNEIREYANEVKKLIIKKQALLDALYAKQRSIDITDKECPVCKSKVLIESKYCSTCGWFFPPLSHVEGIDIEIDQSALITARTKWEGIEDIYDYKSQNERLKKNNKNLSKDIEEKTISLEEKERVILSYVEQIKERDKKTDNLLSQIKNLNSQIEQRNNQIAQLESSLDELNNKKQNKINENPVRGLKYYFKQHNKFTGIMLLISVFLWSFYGLGWLFECIRNYSGFSIDLDNDVVFMLHGFFMAYCNFQIFRFKRSYFLWTLIISLLIGCWSSDGDGGVTFSFVASFDLLWCYLLLLLKKNGVRGITRFSFKDSISDCKDRMNCHNIVTKVVMFCMIAYVVFMFIASSLNSRYNDLPKYVLAWLYLYLGYSLYKVLIFNWKGIVHLFHSTFAILLYYVFFLSVVKEKIYFDMPEIHYITAIMMAFIVTLLLCLPKSREIWRGVDASYVHIYINFVLFELMAISLMLSL